MIGSACMHSELEYFYVHLFIVQKEMPFNIHESPYNYWNSPRWLNSVSFNGVFIEKYEIV